MPASPAGAPQPFPHADAFAMLSEPIRRYVRDRGWDHLRDIQGAAIRHVMGTQDNYILISSTASGKTEAAFLPVLSLVDFTRPGVQVLYISPLIALINDQFARVEQLCQHLDVPVTKWHGEANRTDKKRIIADPRGVVLITPESIEAMYVNAPQNVRALFGGLRFIIIDEIHSFLGTDRGLHLMSLLSRLAQGNALALADAAKAGPAAAEGLRACRVLGLSATLSEQSYPEVKRMAGRPEHTRILRDPKRKPIQAEFRYFQSGGADLPPALLDALYADLCNEMALVFPNSRGRAEEVAVGLRERSRRGEGHQNYWSHHSSVDKEERRQVEEFAKASTHQPFVIACTSTLELGIDIGSVDVVAQVDATHSIASLIQRVGRSGRRGGQASRLLLYSTSPFSLLQSLACWLLYLDGYVEPLRMAPQPYDVLLHQALSTVRQYSQITRPRLAALLLANAAFEAVPAAEADALIAHMLHTGLLEEIGGAVIIGVEGEFIVNSREFYSMFTTDVMLRVRWEGSTIGQLESNAALRVGGNFYLAARIWTVEHIDYRARVIEVHPAPAGRKPNFLGEGGSVSHRIRTRMLEVLVRGDSYEVLDEACELELYKLRVEYSPYAIADAAVQRPLQVQGGTVVAHLFAGSLIYKSIGFLLGALGEDHNTDPDQIEMTFNMAVDAFPALVQRLIDACGQAPALVEAALADPETAMKLDTTKWGQHLPLAQRAAVVVQRLYDFEAARHFLMETEWVQAGPLPGALPGAGQALAPGQGAVPAAPPPAQAALPNAAPASAPQLGASPQLAGIDLQKQQRTPAPAGAADEAAAPGAPPGGHIRRLPGDADGPGHEAHKPGRDGGQEPITSSTDPNDAPTAD